MQLKNTLTLSLEPYALKFVLLSQTVSMSQYNYKSLLGSNCKNLILPNPTCMCTIYVSYPTLHVCVLYMYLTQPYMYVYYICIFVLVGMMLLMEFLQLRKALSTKRYMCVYVQTTSSGLMITTKLVYHTSFQSTTPLFNVTHLFSR